MAIINGVYYKSINVKKENVFDYMEKIRAGDGKRLGYRVLQNIAYYSERYHKWIGVEAGDRSDGATYVKDIKSFGWLFHDELCNEGIFEDGSECNNWQASQVLTDIMSKEGFWFRSNSWFIGTWLFGGGKARDNGMF